MQEWALTVLAGIFVGVVSGLMAAMAWFRDSKNRVYERITGMEKEMKDEIKLLERQLEKVTDLQSEQRADIRVFASNLLNTTEALRKIDTKAASILEQLIQRRSGE